MMKNFFKMLLGVIVLCLMVFYAGVGDVIGVLPTINIYYLIPVIPVYFLFLVLSSYGTRLLVNVFNDVSFKGVFRSYVLSWVVGLLLPSKVGEFSIIYYLKKQGLSIGEGIAISLMDKLVTLGLYSMVTFVGVFFFFERAVAFKIISVLSVLGVCFLFCLWLGFKGSLNRFLPKKIGVHYSDFYVALLRLVRKHKLLLVFNFLITVLRFGLYSLVYSFYFASLGLKVGFISIMVVNMITSLISLVPVSVNGLGIRQSVGVLLFEGIGVSPVYSVNMFLIALFFTYFVALISYLALFKSK